VYPIIICYQKPGKQQGSAVKRLYPQTILIPEQICLESSNTHTHMCAHTCINSCGFATAAIYVVYSLPAQSFMPSPSSFSETVSAGVAENACDTRVGIKNLLPNSSPDS